MGASPLQLDDDWVLIPDESPHDWSLTEQQKAPNLICDETWMQSVPLSHYVFPRD